MYVGTLVAPNANKIYSLFDFNIVEMCNVVSEKHTPEGLSLFNMMKVKMK